jgi:site-specific recombinase XerD
MKDVPHSIPLGSKRFVHRIRRDFRNKGYAYQTEKTYIHWIKRFIRFHKYQHPESMGATHINQFLSFLGSERHCSPATQRIALNALVYLYRKFLQRELEPLDFARARQKRRLPVVLSHNEVSHLLEQMQGPPRLMVELLYGSGLRLNELLSLRIKDLDFELLTLTVRSGKGDKDRTTLLPVSLNDSLSEQITRVEKLHRRDLEDGYGEVYLPYALARKYPNASRELGWRRHGSYQPAR